MGRPGLADLGEVGEVYRPIADIAERYIEVAAGNRDVDGLADAIAINGQKWNIVTTIQLIQWR